FLMLAAYTCIWTSIPFSVQPPLGASHEAAGWWLQLSLIFFLVTRFVMVWLMGKFDSKKLLVVMCVLGTVFTIIGIVSGNVIGAVAIAALSGCISLLFPTIYGVEIGRAHV